MTVKAKRPSWEVRLFLPVRTKIMNGSNRMSLNDDPKPKYRDREAAGKVLASRLAAYRVQDPLVLAIPNGGVPVGIEIAEALDAKLHLMIVRKLQIPDRPEAGFGAATSDGFTLLNERLVEYLRLSEKIIQQQKDKALESIRSRQRHFGELAELPRLRERTVILVDDGLASGFTMKAAVRCVRNEGAKSVSIAVPTSSMHAYRMLETEVDKIICPDLSRVRIFAVANAYENWYDLDQVEVLNLLRDFPRKRG
jgi:predicted phosphoribosyltransferase